MVVIKFHLVIMDEILLLGALGKNHNQWTQRQKGGEKGGGDKTQGDREEGGREIKDKRKKKQTQTIQNNYQKSASTPARTEENNYTFQ